jgi:hypothetical protein
MSSLARLHQHDGGLLTAASHPPAIPVLDQENLTEQGIRVSQIVRGAADADALGSCVANASTAALSAALTPARLRDLPSLLPAYRLGASPVLDEEFAISLYHDITIQTGSPESEWPPADCGSNGLWACQYLERAGVIAGSKVAHGAESILSLMQQGGLITGQPWLNAWMNPGPDGFIDGYGTAAQLSSDIQRGVAGGHETYWYAIETIGYTLDGGIDPGQTVIRFRNSWGEGWALSGDGLAHLSTFVALGQWCDHRSFTPAI